MKGPLTLKAFLRVICKLATVDASKIYIDINRILMELPCNGKGNDPSRCLI